MLKSRACARISAIIHSNGNGLRAQETARRFCVLGPLGRAALSHPVTRAVSTGSTSTCGASSTARAPAGATEAATVGSEASGFAAIGAMGGAVGAVVGIGGGNVMVPLMTLWSRSLTQHEITATSLVAVVGTGLAASSVYIFSGAVHVPAALLITGVATLSAPFGACLAAKLSAAHLRLCLAIFVLGCAPLVPMKSMLFQDSTVAKESHNDAAPAPLTDRAIVTILASGAVAGLTSGLLGIGGGVVLTPTLALTTDMPHQTVLGTSLAAMVIPSLVGASVHYRAGTLNFRAGAPLALGAAAGAAIGSMCASNLPEKHLRWVFSGVMGGVGVYMLRGALRALRYVR